MSKFDDLLIEIGLDTKNLKKGIKEVNSIFSDMSKSLNSTLNIDKNVVSKSAKNLTPLEKKIKELSNKKVMLDTKQLKSSIKESIALLKESGMEVKSFQNKLNAIRKPESLSKLKEDLDFKVVKMGIQSSIDKVKALGQETSELQKKFNSAKDINAFKSIEKEVNSTLKSLQKFQDETNKEMIKDVKASEKAKTKIYKDEAQKRILEAKKEASEIKNTLSKRMDSSRRGSLSGKSASDSARAFEAAFKAEKQNAEKLHRIKTEKDRERFITRQRHRAKLHRQKLADEQKELTASRKALQERLKAFKTNKSTQEKLKNDLDAKQKSIDSSREKRIKRMISLEEQLRASRSFRSMGMKDQEAALKRFEKIRSKFVETGNMSGFKTLTADMRDFKREMKGLSTIQNGLTDSTRNMIRSYASLFALFEGTSAINRVGQDFEAMRASMLTASDSQADAAKKLDFVRQQARRLGIDLVAASKAYLQLNIAANNVITQAQTDELFIASMEAATAFGMSLDDTKGTFRAFIQMKNLYCRAPTSK